MSLPVINNGFQPGANLYTQGFGSRPENVEVPHLDSRAPSALDIKYPVGKRWIDQLNRNTYELMGFDSSTGTLTAVWIAVGGSASGVATINSNAAVAGNYIIAGTANQITATQTAGTTTLSIPAAFTAPGSVTATTTLTATLGNITATNGNFVKNTAGNKDIYTSVATTTTAGANSAGTVTLAAGVAIVATTAVTANSQIRLYRQGIGATGAAALGYITLFAKTANTSFEIRAVTPAAANVTETTDVSVIAWEIVN